MSAENPTTGNDAYAATPPPDRLGEEIDFKAVARQLQSDMSGFRERQQRLAEQQVASEKARLLASILPIADDLERALKVDNPKDLALWKGVLLVRKELIRLLESEGVTRIEAFGAPFDPELHQAVGRRPANAPTGTVVEEIAPGYLMAGQLLRAAQVIVAS